ncbi:FlgO family outer membrane protein [Desulfotalea psychrophila]|nr:FlgO family outer membrane protein [Desulfotalea psychrophila]
MKKKSTYYCPLFLGFVSALLFLGACSTPTFDHTPLAARKNLILFSYDIVDDLVENAMPPIIPGNPEQPILVTTVVSNNNLQKTSAFGRLIQQQVISRFVQHNYIVKEIKLEDKLHIRPQTGETILSRHPQNIKEEQTAQAIFTGTTSRANRVLYISARLINPKDGTIISANDYSLTIDEHIMALLGLEEDDRVAEPERPIMNSILE